MPQKPTHEPVRCQFFLWRLVRRKENNVWYADARAAGKNLGRHSLGTRDKDEALRNLARLDRLCAEEQGLVAPSKDKGARRHLPLAKGRKLYDEHNARPRIVGGIKKSTQKRYRPILDKFLAFLKTKRINDWHDVTKTTLAQYADHLTENGYAYKTIHNELTTLKTAVKWLCNEGHIDSDPIELKLKKADCQRAYCYTPEEVAAMLDHCRTAEDLTWLGNVITALACTGVRIEELVSLKWSDIKFDERALVIVDESGFANQSVESRTTKSSRGRYLPIRRELLEVLRSMPKKDKYVFRGPRGGRLKADTVRNCLVRHVIKKLTKRFPKPFPGEKSFEDGRLHSFRHFFCSVCANTGVPERIVMEWLGHADSAMVRHYYHLKDEESRRKMDQLDLFGKSDGRSVTDDEQNL